MPEECLAVSNKEETAAMRYIVEILSDNGILSAREREKILSEYI